ncbi:MULTISPECIES: hypothetical protein [unclassified Streptomyces]|uniref:hypothetical protein n=1 Tax=unclassified Streptomyces TaxID=2593676 RepID=UPI000D6C748A|nr:hypothetical protein [Streptomyces sp. CG 926]PWK74459.1 hypothetical protein BCL76_101188 [Streptomyces sp. CG 926]
MARRSDTSCGGIGCLGLLLVLFVLPTVGYLLAVPLALPDLLAEQSPPQQLHGFGQYLIVYAIPAVVALLLAVFASRRRTGAWWLVPVRAVALLALVAAVLWWTESRVGEYPVWNVRATAESMAAGLVALAFVVAVRRWDASRGGTRVAGAAHRPAPGEIWLAMVPLREDPARQLRHYCVVLAVHPGHAEVAQITTKDKDGRTDHIRIPNDGWDKASGRAHWVEFGRTPRLVDYGMFLKSRPQGRCPAPVWRQLSRQLG